MLNDSSLIKSNGNQNDDGWYIDRKDDKKTQDSIKKFAFLIIIKHFCC